MDRMVMATLNPFVIETGTLSLRIIGFRWHGDGAERFPDLQSSEMGQSAHQIFWQVAHVRQRG